MRWSDLKDGVWHVPQHDGREKGVGDEPKLPQMALDVIQSQPRIGKDPYVFRGRGGVAFNAWAKRKGELDAKLAKLLPEMTPWRIHDLRRTARTLMSRAEVRPDIGERVIGHKIKGVEAVYDRHKYEAQKADALKRLAQQIGMILNPPKGNVVSLAKRRRK
jgi:integrase